MWVPCGIKLILRLMLAKDVKALVAIGGWTGSRYFSTNVGSAQNRTAFVKTIVNLVKKYNLDGVDFESVHSPSLQTEELTSH